MKRGLSVAPKSKQYAGFRHAQVRARGSKEEAEDSSTGRGPVRSSSQISVNKSATSSLSPPTPRVIVELPRRNPFLWGPQHETSDEDDDDKFFRPADGIVTRKASKLTTAGESGFFDTTVETGQEATAIRVAAGAVYFRWHVIDESDLRVTCCGSNTHPIPVICAHPAELHEAPVGLSKQNHELVSAESGCYSRGYGWY